MARLPILMALLLTLAACDGQPKKTPSQPAAEGPTPDPVSPPTGITVLQRDHDDLRKDLSPYLGEEATAPPAGAKDLFLKRADILRMALDVAVKAEAKQLIEQRRARLQGERAKLEQERTTHFIEIGELESILSEFEKGVASIPKGFTEAEMRDQASDLRELVRELAGSIDKVVEELAEVERILIETPEAIVHPGGTLLFREREALAALRAQIEALPQG